MTTTGRRRRVRTPVILQMEAVECGAVCLGIVLAHFGRRVPLDELREACGVSRDGCNAADIARAARRYALEATGWRRQPHELRKMRLPLILFWKFEHFVVLEGFGRGGYRINDPADGHRTVSEETFDKEFTGLVLEVAPGPRFERGGERPRVLRRLWPWLRGFKAPLAFAVGCGLLVTVPGLALPLLLAVFVDAVLGGLEPAWGAPIVGAMAAAAGLVYLLTWLQQRCLRRLSAQLAVTQADRVLTRLLQLPITYFGHRFAGDLTARMQLIDGVANAAAGQIVRIVIELAMSGLFLGLMLALDPALAAAVALLAASSAALTFAVGRLRLDHNRRWRHEQGALVGTAADGLRRIESLHATATENDFFARWSGRQARELTARQQFLELGHVTASFPALFQVLGNAVVLGFGGWRVLSGEMTLGVLMGFFVVAGNFLGPVGRFVEFADRFRMLDADLQRIDDVRRARRDPMIETRRTGPTERVATLDGRLRLAGRVEIDRLTFGYRPRRPPLISDFSLTVEPGQRIAVVGPSGSGKSTLIALLAGIHRPWSGQITIDGHPRDAIPRELLTTSVAAVDQHVFLFDGTVRENLTLWDDTVPDEALIAAARDASIHDDIATRPLGYDSAVQQGGRNFSGGQRQRLEIARALVHDPSVLFLDEATAALDTVNEARVDDALRRRGCACLIVAHRLSTIRDCDLIVVLDRGREVQRGSHDELMAATGGRYRQLVEAN